MPKHLLLKTEHNSFPVNGFQYFGSSLGMRAKSLLVLYYAPMHTDKLECQKKREIQLLFLLFNVTNPQKPIDQGVTE